MQAVTASGRIYTLTGPPEVDSHAGTAWRASAGIYEVADWVDSTQSVLDAYVEVANSIADPVDTYSTSLITELMLCHRQL